MSDGLRVRVPVPNFIEGIERMIRATGVTLGLATALQKIFQKLDIRLAHMYMMTSPSHTCLGKSPGLSPGSTREV